jgi:uncharacterized Zn-binding protein involved in type VI secretion
MGQPAAKQGDKIFADDMHFIRLPPIPNPVLLLHKFNGIIDGNLSSDVTIMGEPAAIQGSTATNTPLHEPGRVSKDTPPPQGASFVTQPDDQGTIQTGSATVTINGQPAARSGDAALTCNDLPGPPLGTVMAEGTVLIGG